LNFFSSFFPFRLVRACERNEGKTASYIIHGLIYCLSSNQFPDNMTTAATIKPMSESLVRGIDLMVP
jgi:hypothetical protein